jgi:hypothetical protein
MTDITTQPPDIPAGVPAVLTIFEMKNETGYYVPRFNFRFYERDTKLQWYITFGGTQAYVMRFDPDTNIITEEAVADSHFMINRVISALMISRAGIFIPIVRGRIFFNEVHTLNWTSQILLEISYSDEVHRVHGNFNEKNFEGWLTAIISQTFLRRAMDDVVLALKSPTEPFLYIYRGFEWLEDGLKISKKEMAAAVGVELKEFKQLGRIANQLDAGVRHASRTGTKMRPDFGTYSTWICGLIDAVNYARNKLDRSFTVMSPTDVADAVKISLSPPYR